VSQRSRVGGLIVPAGAGVVVARGLAVASPTHALTLGLDQAAADGVAGDRDAVA
jgi:hypothetical protein